MSICTLFIKQDLCDDAYSDESRLRSSPVVLLFLYISFSRAGKDVRRERLREQAVKWVKCGGGVRRAAACLWGSLRATLRVTFAADAPRCI